MKVLLPERTLSAYWEYLMTGKLPAHDYQEEVKRVEGEQDSMPL